MNILEYAGRAKRRSPLNLLLRVLRALGGLSVSCRIRVHSRSFAVKSNTHRRYNLCIFWSTPEERRGEYPLNLLLRVLRVLRALRGSSSFLLSSRGLLVSCRIRVHSRLNQTLIEDIICEYFGVPRKSEEEIVPLIFSSVSPLSSVPSVVLLLFFFHRVLRGL